MKSEILKGDCLEVLKKYEQDSFDSLITDPPAGISFMGKEWDKGHNFIPEMTEIYKECLRVLKPGAHGLVWAIPRTSHWTATALENAGFEIRDVITHIFGSGFPKSHDISKAIDKMYGAEREVIGPNKYANRGRVQSKLQCDVGKSENSLDTKPATTEAKKWQGFGTAIKPASEHYILVRKPLSESTVAKNVLKHGTGGLNIDQSRISTSDSLNGGAYSKEGDRNPTSNLLGAANKEYHQPQGRFPANLVLSHNEDCELVGTKEVKGITGSNTGLHGENSSGEFKGLNPQERVGSSKETVDDWQCTEGCAVKELNDQSGRFFKTFEGEWKCTEDCPVAEIDKQSGVLKFSYATNEGKASSIYNNEMKSERNIINKDRAKDYGGASRFFYCAKASKRDRGQDNNHPTVKNTKLMEYLIKLITPPQGIVLDPFAGSGSTGVAAKRLGFGFVGIEKEAEYFEIAEKRIEAI